MERIAKSRKAAAWRMALGLCFVISAAACSTVMTRYVGPDWTPPDPPLPRIYSGTLFDFRCFLRPQMHDTQGLGGYCLVDVPFSIIADTVLLPLTIYEQIRYGSYAKGKERETPSAKAGSSPPDATSRADHSPSAPDGDRATP